MNEALFWHTMYRSKKCGGKQKMIKWQIWGIWVILTRWKRIECSFPKFQCRLIWGEKLEGERKRWTHRSQQLGLFHSHSQLCYKYRWNINTNAEIRTDTSLATTWTFLHTQIQMKVQIQIFVRKGDRAWKYLPFTPI